MVISTCAKSQKIAWTKHSAESVWWYYLWIIGWTFTLFYSSTPDIDLRVQDGSARLEKGEGTVIISIFINNGINNGTLIISHLHRFKSELQILIFLLPVWRNLSVNYRTTLNLNLPAVWIILDQQEQVTCSNSNCVNTFWFHFIFGHFSLLKYSFLFGSTKKNIWTGFPRHSLFFLHSLFAV